MTLFMAVISYAVLWQRRATVTWLLFVAWEYICLHDKGVYRHKCRVHGLITSGRGGGRWPQVGYRAGLNIHSYILMHFFIIFITYNSPIIDSAHRQGWTQLQLLIDPQPCLGSFLPRHWRYRSNKTRQNSWLYVTHSLAV